MPHAVAVADEQPEPHPDAQPGAAQVPHGAESNEEATASPAQEARKPRMRWPLFVLLGLCVAATGAILAVKGTEILAYLS